MKNDGNVATTASSSAYRPDIDGLRAIAVLSVIIYHINKTLIPGGFVGVDIFFVISGYLISTHLFNTGRNGSFSLVDFYFRRIRRIVPAMTLVVLVTLIVAQFILLPEDSRETAKSAVWSFASMANVYFWLYQDTSYFAASSNELPLLHLWSLGVEEQFYLVWPFLAIILSRWRFAPLMGVLLAVAGLSFALGQLSFHHSPGFAYYMLPSRCGELLVGAMVAAMVVHGKHRILQRYATLLTCAGMALVLASFAAISEANVFPGLWAMLPTFGAGLLILGGHWANPVSDLLSRAPLRRIGAISYSAYLWHWPLLAFYRYGYGEPGLTAGCIIFVLTLLLAELSYRWIEQPVRQSAITLRTGYVGWFASSFLMAGMALAFVYPSRVLQNPDSDYARSLTALRALDLPTERFDYVCLRKVLGEHELRNPQCVMGRETHQAPRVLLMGDSNAAHYIGIIGTFAEHDGFHFRNLQVGSCPPVFGDVTHFADARRWNDCLASQKVWRAALDQADIVILGGSWTAYQAKSAQFLPTLLEQVRGYTAMGKEVVLLGKVPLITHYDRLCREKALRYPFKDCEAPSNAIPDDVVEVNSALKQFAEQQPNVRYFNVDDLICPEGVCSAYDRNRKNLYFNRDHLSMEGSWELGRQIFQAKGVPPVF